jgi:hypothetical protein
MLPLAMTTRESPLTTPDLTVIATVTIPRPASLNIISN